MELTNLVAAMRSRARKSDPEELSETEFLALDLLVKNGTMNVGEIQREIGVLPAQMSRLMRALEGKGVGSLVECRINEDDRRKVDVTLSDVGRKEWQEYRDARRQTNIEFLEHLDPADREGLMRGIRSFRRHVVNMLHSK